MNPLSIDHVSSIGHRGPKSTKVNFGPLHDGTVRLWAWISNDTAADIAEGMRVLGDFTIRPSGEVERSYVSKETGAVIEKRVPTQQVWLNGHFIFDAPEASATVIEVTDQGKAYAESIRNKKTAPVTEEFDGF